MKNKAFTLIELLVVVLIIGILAAIAVPQYQVAVAKSRFATLLNLTNEMANSQQRYYLANGIYASNINDLDMGFPGGSVDGRLIYFDWGRCYISNNSETSKEVYCYNGQVYYGIYLRDKGVTNHACVTSCDNQVYNKVCQSLSKASPRDISGLCYYYF